MSTESDQAAWMNKLRQAKTTEELHAVFMELPEPEPFNMDEVASNVKLGPEYDYLLTQGNCTKTRMTLS